MSLVATEPRLCALIPVFDHEEAIGSVVEPIVASGLPCLLVDDGSGQTCASTLDTIARNNPGVVLIRRIANGGKGAAVSDGLRAALAAGYTHAIQIDADGQHDLQDLPRFIAACRHRPDGLVCGQPRFDESIPRTRFYSRYLTHIFVWLNTLSFEIRDAMCGYRVYPLEQTVAMIEQEHPGLRMDFDIEVLVRLHWRGVPMQWIDTRVTYPIDGVSHFRLVLDNVLISRVHTRLFVGMLLRLPRLLARRWRRVMEPRHA
jgi:glycosyltransferase involved in cell wall biosynthesis